MKRMIAYTTLALVLIAGSYQLVFAKPSTGKGNGNCTQNQAINYVEKLKLTDDQISKISVLIQKDNTTNKTLHEKIQTAMTSLREMEWSKNFKQATVDQLIKDRDDARTAMQTNHQKLITDIKALLTADQQKLFEDLGFGCIGGGCGGGNGSGCGNGNRKGCGRK
jgi:Spy/CpxP family protein refolding chaperone